MKKIAVITAKFNYEITSQLELGCTNELKEQGISFEKFYCPGSVELVFASQKLIKTEQFDAVVVLGAVIKGDTDHYEYVCNFVTKGIANINSTSNVPVIFGVLTVTEEVQAVRRADINDINLGASFAKTAIEMANFGR